MADSQIEEVKSRTDIVALVSNYVALKKSGRNYKGLCPFHVEKTPSFMVSSERQIFKCFGCNEGGDVLTFYQKIEGVEFGEALKFLASKAGVQLAEYKPSPSELQKEKLLEIVALAANFYHFLLTQHPSGKKPMEYLKGRGVSVQSIKDWQLGFAPNNWDSLYKFLVKKNFKLKDIFTSSLSLPSTGRGAYDRFRSRIMFPIRNISGSVVGFSGRIFGDGEPKYLNSPDSLLFNKSNNLFGLDLAKSEIKKQNQAVLVEGNLDVISSYQVGVKNVVAPLGTALTEKQIELLRRFGENLVISFDQDQAGQAAALRAVELAEKAGLTIKLTELETKDPDELIKKSPGKWKEAIEKASSIYDYSLNTLVKRYGTSSPDAIRRITKEIVPLLAKIDNQISRSHYERLLAKKLEVSEESIRAEINKVGKQVLPVSKKEEVTLADQHIFENYLIALILQTKIVPKELPELDFQNRKLQSFAELIVASSKEGTLDSEKLFETLPAEIKDDVEQLIFNDIDENILGSQDKSEKEIKTCTLRLKELNLRARLKKLTLEIKQAELIKEDEKITFLSKQFNEISQKLSQLEKED